MNRFPTATEAHPSVTDKLPDDLPGHVLLAIEIGRINGKSVEEVLGGMKIDPEQEIDLERVRELDALIDQVREELTQEALADAENPTTPADELASLANHPDVRVRKAVTRHPGTPTKTLVSLGTRYPAELLKNPVFDMFFLENPAFLLAIPVAFIKGLIDQPGFLEDHVDTLLLHPDADVGYAIGKCSHLSAEMIELLESECRRQPVRLGLAENKKTPAHVLEQLAHDRDPLVQWAVAENPNTPTPALETLAAGLKTEPVRRWLARHSNSTPEILRELAADRVQRTRLAVAENRNTPRDVLRALEKDESMVVRRAAKRTRATLRHIAVNRQKR